MRGRGRAGAVRRQTQGDCKEYMEAGEKYLDCQDRQLTTVMEDWPKDINHLLLARNKIQVRRATENEPNRGSLGLNPRCKQESVNRHNNDNV